MPDIFALQNLYTRVSAILTADSTPCENMFGWRKPAQHALTNRIVWVPGDPSGAIGEQGPARNPGQWPRSLGTLHELFYVVINGYDPADPEDEMLQYLITRRLRDAWYRAVYQVAHGAFARKDERWLTGRIERRHGTAVRVIASIEATLPDTPFSQVPPWVDAPDDTEIEAEVSLLDVTELVTTDEGP